MNSKEKRNNIDLINRELEKIWKKTWVFRLNSLVFQATYKLWSEKIKFSFKNLKKIVFYIFLVYNFDNLISKLKVKSDSNKKKLVLRVSQRKDHYSMWEGYLIKLGIKQESDVIDINLQKKTINPLFLKIWNHSLVLKILNLFNKIYKLSFFQKIFFYFELHYCLKTNNYYSNFLENIKFTELYCVWDNNYPILAIALWFRKKNLNVNSFQFFNFSEDWEFKIHQESTWLNMVANKYPGIRSALCWNIEIAELARAHNNANICALPGRFINQSQAIAIMKAFLNTQFDGGRHERRIKKIPILP